MRIKRHVIIKKLTNLLAGAAVLSFMGAVTAGTPASSRSRMLRVSKCFRALA